MKQLTGFQGEPGVGKTIQFEGLPEYFPTSDPHIGAPENSFTEFVKRILDTLPETVVIVFISDELELKK